MWALIQHNFGNDYCIENYKTNQVFRERNSCWTSDIPHLIKHGEVVINSTSPDYNPPSWEGYQEELATDNCTLILATPHHPSTWLEHHPEELI